MSLFSKILEAKGFPFNKAYLMLKEWRKRGGDNNYQEQKKWEIFNYHIKNNPFYADFLKDKKIEKWSDVPIITKNELRQENVVTPLFQPKELYKSKTSGSSGKPLIYSKDKFCHAITWAYIYDCYQQIGLEYGKDLQARFYAIPLEGFSYYIEKLKDFLSHRHRFIIYNLSDDDMKKYLTVFQKKQFKYLYGYTNSLVIFAKYLIKNELVIKKICPTISCCIVTSEVCTKEDKLLLEKAFGVPVYNEYGSSELSLLAMDNKNTSWKLNNFELFIEFLDDNYLPVQENQTGKIVVTSLYNKAMPFIRYEVGDLGQYQGEQLIQLDGRLNDSLRLPSGKIMPGFTLYYVTKALVENNKNIQEYTIRQTKINQLEIDFVLDGELQQSFCLEVEKIVQKYLEPEMSVIVNKVLEIPRTGAGKFKHFKSEL